MYPDPTELFTYNALAFLPPSLEVFLCHIICGDNLRKVACIGQPIIQTSRPGALLAPLQLGQGVQMHYQLHSNFLIDIFIDVGILVLTVKKGGTNKVQLLESALIYRKCLHNVYCNLQPVM